MSFSPRGPNSPTSPTLTTAAPNTPTALILGPTQLRSPKLRRWMFLGAVAFIGGYWVLDPMRVRTIDSFYREMNDLPPAEAIDTEQLHATTAVVGERAVEREPLAKESQLVATTPAILATAKETPLSEQTARAPLQGTERADKPAKASAPAVESTREKSAPAKRTAAASATKAGSQKGMARKVAAAEKASKKGKGKKSAPKAAPKGQGAKAKKASAPKAAGAKAKSTKS